MVLKNFSVTLEVEEVKKAKKKIEPTGGKISPVLNNLLKEWNKNKEEKK